MYSERGDLKEAGFPHSEICGSAPICRLPAAYRRLSRPSSPIIAKASTTCTYSLDPITLLPQTTKHPRAKSPKASQRNKKFSRLCVARIDRSIEQHDAIHNPVSPRQLATPHNHCARPRQQEQLYLLSRIVKERTSCWWVWMDSNHRPPPYQDGALTN